MDCLKAWRADKSKDLEYFVIFVKDGLMKTEANLFPSPDFQIHGTKAHLDKQWPIWKHLQIGWNDDTHDTTLMIELPKVGEKQYVVYVWNRPGVRAEIAALLGLPVHIMPEVKGD